MLKSYMSVPVFSRSGDVIGYERVDFPSKNFCVVNAG